MTSMQFDNVYYGIQHKDGYGKVIAISQDKEEAVKALDATWPYLIEMTVTKRWTINPVLTEVKNEN